MIYSRNDNHNLSSPEAALQLGTFLLHIIFVYAKTTLFCIAKKMKASPVCRYEPSEVRTQGDVIDKIVQHQCFILRDVFKTDADAKPGAIFFLVDVANGYGKFQSG